MKIFNLISYIYIQKFCNKKIIFTKDKKQEINNKIKIC